MEEELDILKLADNMEFWVQELMDNWSEDKPTEAFRKSLSYDLQIVWGLLMLVKDIPNWPPSIDSQQLHRKPLKPRKMSRNTDHEKGRR